ncbi:MAG: glucose transporter [Cytophagaceae bacterium]|jgi:FHS family L-fucose permease-like MFS transporter|nr:glucose transporter [Cytophagaceae bacterium]
MEKSKSTTHFATLITVFFFWGFLAASNGVFIPFCKGHFNLTQFQSQLIDLAFYFAYFLGSLTLYLYQRVSKVDLLNKIGYKMGIVYGLIISAAGALTMIGSISLGNYWLILASFFLIAIGFSLQQTCAQPFAIALGDPSTGSHRLNLAGGVNSFAATVGPIIVSYFLFGSLKGAETVEISSVNTMYGFLAALFLGVALFFYKSQLPSVTSDEELEPGAGALKYPQLVLGMIAIFVYVGVEVTIQSNLGALLKLPEFGGYAESSISHFISLYWGSMMIGRWTGSITVFNLSKFWFNVWTIIVPYIAFAVILGANIIGGNDVHELYIYAAVIPLLILAIFLGQEKPARTLLILSFFGIGSMLVGLFTTGQVAVFAFVSGGLYCSTMWPCIFALAVAGLGKYTSQGSTFLIMMILGGAIIPPAQGLLADVESIGIHQSYWLAVACFAYLAFYGYKVALILKSQGVEFNQKAAGH